MECKRCFRVLYLTIGIKVLECHSPMFESRRADCPQPRKTNVRAKQIKIGIFVFVFSLMIAGKISSIIAAGPIKPGEIPLARQIPALNQVEERLNLLHRHLQLEIPQLKKNLVARLNSFSLKQELDKVLDRFFRQFSENASPRMIIVNPKDEEVDGDQPEASITPTPIITASVTPTATPTPTLTPTPTPTVSLSPQPTNPPAVPKVEGGYHVAGGKIYQGEQVLVINGVNWFGFETANNTVHGLWSRNYQEMISQMKDLGFNAVRIPFCPKTVANGPVSGIDYSQNPDLEGLGGLEVLDKIIEELEAQEIYFVLDHHRPDCNAISELPTTSNYSESEWIADLTALAQRYQDKSYFLGMDLKNEPHGAATWGTGDSTDWKLAAEKAGKAVLAANPKILILVEGIQNNPSCSDNSVAHWWGGNLEPQACFPLDLPKEKLVLSPHVYGPDVFPQEYFQAPDFPENMPAIWEKHFGFLSGDYALIVGEWGGKYGAGDPRDLVWQNALIDYLAKKKIHSFYWSWNPNSGDTGGILNDDWTSVRQDKIEMLQNYGLQMEKLLE